MTTQQQIGTTLTARAARARRAAERWIEAGGNLQGTPVDVVAQAVIARAEELERDLDLDEVDRVCLSAVAAAVDAEGQRAAQHAIAGAREEERERERLEYLKKRAVDYRQGLGGAGIRPPRGERA